MAPAARHPKALFLEVCPGGLGKRYVLHHEQQGSHARGLVVYIHPFAEEMNKSRRMAAKQSRALADAGFEVLQLDLLGCGDSAGDFGDATWSRWVADVVAACEWLQEQHRARQDSVSPLPPLWLWGLRAGCLLGVEAAAHLRAPCHFMFWQPTPSGRLVLQQFLRLKVAGDLLGGHAKGVTEKLKNQLASGVSLDIAGYELGSELCRGLEQATLRPPQGPAVPAGRVEWLEVSKLDDAVLTPAAIQAAACWSDAGWAWRARVVRGPAFWQTAEIEDAPDLLVATVLAMTSAA